MKIKTINSASSIIGATGIAITVIAGWVFEVDAWMYAVVGVVSFGVLFLASQMVIRKFITYKIKPIYQIVLARDIKTDELEQQLAYRKDMVGCMESELSNWAQSNNRELARLKANEQYRREFLGNISHELKTPIFTMQGYILTLLDGGIDDPAINRKYLERTEKSIDRMIDIVTDLEEISMLESGVLALHKERFDITSLAREIAEDGAMEAEKSGITIIIEDSPYISLTSSVYVVADRKYIEQVLWNLVVNSIKYGREGGVTRISFADLFDKVIIEVSDNGIGIEPEDIPRVFERFFRIDKSRSRELGGTGLGLSIVKHIVEAHNEQITLRSQPNQGTTFSFTLTKG